MPSINPGQEMRNSSWALHLGHTASPEAVDCSTAAVSLIAATNCLGAAFFAGARLALADLGVPTWAADAKRGALETITSVPARPSARYCSRAVLGSFRFNSSCVPRRSRSKRLDTVGRDTGHSTRMADNRVRRLLHCRRQPPLRPRLRHRPKKTDLGGPTTHSQGST